MWVSVYIEKKMNLHELNQPKDPHSLQPCCIEKREEKKKRSSVCAGWIRTHELARQKITQELSWVTLGNWNPQTAACGIQLARSIGQTTFAVAEGIFEVWYL